jgi:creatinine amidohydrolase
MYFASLKAGEIERERVARTVVLLPLGSFEQHGQHLPFNTDSTIAGAISQGIEKELRDDVLLLPPLWYGNSGQHLMLGEISATARTYIDMLKDIVRSLARMGACKILFLNAHGGNEVPASLAILELKREFRATNHGHVAVVLTSWWRFVQDVLDEQTTGMAKSAQGTRLGSGVGHADDIETSVMLHLKPSDVDMARAQAGGPRGRSSYKVSSILSKGYPMFMAVDADEWARNGVNGTPEDGTAQMGSVILEAAIDRLVMFTRDFLTWDIKDCTS